MRYALARFFLGINGKCEDAVSVLFAPFFYLAFWLDSDYVEGKINDSV
jgi:hypothetical protein